MASIADLDEAWLREARQRAAAGQWERAPGAVFDALAAAPRAEPAGAAGFGAPRCPVCEGRPPLEPYRRHGATVPDPIWLCERCHGAWLTAAVLATGFSSREHLPTGLVPPGELPCPACGTAIAPPGPCPSCPPATTRPCPACDVPLAHLELAGVQLDSCDRCRGTWFDLGELAQVYGLDHPAATPSERPSSSRPGAPSPWFIALEVAFQLLPVLLRRR